MLIAVIPMASAGCRCASGDDRPGDEDESTGPGAGQTGDEDPWMSGDLSAQVASAEREAGEPRQGGHIVFQLYTEVPSLNTIVDSDQWATWLTKHHIYETLVARDPYDAPEYPYVPELAERWEISDDHLVYTFYLRRGVKFHDGEDFNADDVVATYEKVQDEGVRAAHVRSYTETLERIEAIDDYTVRFTWSEPYFLALDTPFESVPIQPAHVIADMPAAQYNESGENGNPLNRHPVGTGPLKFVEWDSHEKLVVERFEDYWGRKAYLDRITFRIVEEEAIGVQLAERGELDVVTRIRAETWENLEDNRAIRDRYYRSLYYDNNYMWIGWNNLSPLFNDKRTRRAMSMLIDVDGMIEHLFDDQPRRTTCHFYWASDACPDVEPIPYDPPGAVALLEEAGWRDTNDNGVRDKGGEEFEFTFMIPSQSEDAARIATKMKEDMERAGIELNLQRVEWSSFVTRLREHEFDACTLLWGNTSPDTDPNQIWHSGQAEGGSNYISYRNERVDSIIERARIMFDRDERNRLYREMGEILYDEQPYTWFWTRPRRSLVSRRIRGATESLMFWQFEDFWLADEAEGGSGG
jgi:peptide/nickel transport system substrate-binding protein